MEITKEYLLNKVRRTYNEHKLKSFCKPDIIDLKSQSVRVVISNKKICYFHTIDSKPTTTSFDLTEMECNEIVNATCKW